MNATMVSEKRNQDVNLDVREGRATRAIENQTAKVQSVNFLGLALGSMAVSAGFAVFSKNKSVANFIGLWAPSILVMGLYNKFVKLEAEIKRSQLH